MTTEPLKKLSGDCRSLRERRRKSEGLHWREPLLEMAHLCNLQQYPIDNSALGQVDNHRGLVPSWDALVVTLAEQDLALLEVAKTMLLLRRRTPYSYLLLI